MRAALSLASFLLLALSACNENEEEIDVHPDGSVDVVLSVRGSVQDLAGGYPLPLHAPWSAEGRASELWLRDVGPDTGSAATRSRAGGVDWKGRGLLEGDQLELGARAHFASVEEWPRFFAPIDEPYREAGLERTAELTIEQRGEYRVYSFERTYHGRRRDRYDVFHVLMETAESFPTELVDKLDDEEQLTPDETRFVAARVSAVFRGVYGLLAQDALELEDEDGLSPAAIARIAENAREKIASFLDEARIAKLLDDLRREGEEGDDVDALETLEREARDLLRRSLAEELVAEGIPESLRYTVLGRLEFGFSFADQTSDLSDEKFTVSLALPGTILSGNYDALENGRATWSFDFDAIASSDFVLRAVSVVE